MSRPFTPQELEEYNRRRRKALEETAGKLGMTPEQLEAAEQRARKELSSRSTASKEETETALRLSLEKLSKGLHNISETDYSEDDLDGMSEEDFSNLLALRMSVLDEEERTEAAKVIARKIACWRGGEDEPLSLREEILLDLQAMIRRHNYYAEKK